MIQFLLVITVIFLVLIYKYAHVYLLSQGKKQVLNKHCPTTNPANTLYFFSRVLGLSLILLSFKFHLNTEIGLAIFHMIFWGSISFLIYLISLYIIESIVLYKFEYIDEVAKKENLSFSIVSFSNAIAVAIIIKQLLMESEDSILILILLWLFSMVIFGFANKSYQYFSRFNLSKHIVQKEIGASLSFSGFSLGISLLISEAFHISHYDIQSYFIRVILRILLCLIIAPLIYKGIKFVFNFSHITHQEVFESETAQKNYLGYGIYEGALFLIVSLFTNMIANQITFSVH